MGEHLFVEEPKGADVDRTAFTNDSVALFHHHMRILEAILFASVEPLSVAQLQEQMGAGVYLPPLLQSLVDHYAGRGVNLVSHDGAWSFRTATDLANDLTIVKQPRRKLPRAAAEVLAIIAYHQPVTRADIESIRGVETSKGTLDLLLELGWVRPGKRRETPGRPLTWGTTTHFLSHFNLETLKDLPGLDDLKAAGLLDTRPVLASLPVQGDDNALVEVPDEDQEFAVWVEASAEDASPQASET